MPKKSHGKKYLEAKKKIDSAKNYTVEGAFGLLDQVAYAKFDETVDVAFSLGVDPKHADQMVRGAITLPNGTGKTARVIVLAKGEKAKEAQQAGADQVGAEDIIEKITGGWMEFDKVIATPDMMGIASKVAKILGPRGLMPNPKLGTVTFDVAKAVKEQKQGKVEYRTEKSGIVHVNIGKKSFGAEKLKENFNALLQVIVRAKPPTSKGTYIKNITVSTTMSPGIAIDPGIAYAKAE
jgi:large subunit ribosomal protein L1